MNFAHLGYYFAHMGDLLIEFDTYGPYIIQENTAYILLEDPVGNRYRIPLEDVYWGPTPP